MKKIIITSVVILITFFVVNSGFAQKGQSKPEIAKWKLKDEPKSFWEFKSDEKLYSTYIGSDQTTIYDYKISSTPPLCQEGVSLAIKKNVDFLQLKNLKYGYTKCFYIFGLNDEVLTVMDAESGQTFFFIKAE